MSNNKSSSTEVQPKPERRSFSAEYKRRMVAEADACQHGELGSLLRREGLTYKQINRWRKAAKAGALGKQRGPVADPKREEMRRLQDENERLKRKLADAEAIIDAQKKLAALLDRLSAEEAK